MLKSIPWDVWAAGTLEGGVTLAKIFELRPAAFIVGYIFLCVYIVVETISGARS